MSSRKKIVAANWKMNLLPSEANELIRHVIAGSSGTENVTKIFFPSFTLISEAIKTVGSNPYFVGAQNCSEHEKGAFTGEVSASMLKNAGCTYVLVGHSERRNYFKESNAQLSSKIKLALANGLSPVFCIGEVLADRKGGTHFDVVGVQLHEVLADFTPEDLSKMILAYEPVWAIGTGETATPAQAQEMHAFIRRTVKEMFDIEAALNISILYGGSCNAGNAKELFACHDVDGGLIGGASLKAQELCSIIHSF